MTDNKQVYMYSLDIARQNDELDQYRESRRLSAACAKAIDKAISDSNYKLNHYDLGSAVEKTVSEYGWERVNMVLANTVQYKDYDGRFSHDNKEWAKGIFLPDVARDSRASFVTDAHPYLLDGFIDRARNYQCSIAVTDYIVQQGISNTTQGNWNVDFEDIPAELMKPWQLKHNLEQITDLLSQREEVSDVVINDGCFDVCYYISYCLNYEQPNEESRLLPDTVESPGKEENPSILTRRQEGKKAAAQEAVQPLITMYAEGVSPSVDVVTSTSGDDMFISGKIAMIAAGIWKVPSYSNITMFDWDVVQLPFDATTGKRLSSSNVLGLVINPNSKNLEATVAALEELMQPDCQKILADSHIYIPALASVRDGYFERDKPENILAYQKTLDYLHPNTLTQYIPYSQFVTEYTDALRKAYTGKLTLEDALKAANETINAVMDENKVQFNQ